MKTKIWFIFTLYLTSALLQGRITDDFTAWTLQFKRPAEHNFEATQEWANNVLDAREGIEATIQQKKLIHEFDSELQLLQKKLMHLTSLGDLYYLKGLASGVW